MDNEKTIIQSEKSSLTDFNVVMGGLIVVAAGVIIWSALGLGYIGAIGGIAIGVGVLLFFLLVYLNLRCARCNLTVTDKRVYGNSAFGKRVDLPLDSVSAVGTSVLSGISVATPSGYMRFYLIKNATEIHTEINKLLIARQNKAPINKNKAPQTSAPDELIRYKELLDTGVITQEEFNAKKKQILGL